MFTSYTHTHIYTRIQRNWWVCVDALVKRLRLFIFSCNNAVIWRWRPRSTILTQYFLRSSINKTVKWMKQFMIILKWFLFHLVSMTKKMSWSLKHHYIVLSTVRCRLFIHSFNLFGDTIQRKRKFHSIQFNDMIFYSYTPFVFHRLWSSSNDKRR